VRPIIGVTSSFMAEEGRSPRSYVNAAYTDAIFAAGGIPQPIPAPPEPNDELIEEILARYDGILFTGGPDIDPRHYGQPRHSRTEVMHVRRERFELAFFRKADLWQKPILSICLGCQISNVARGGSLVQHVDDLPRESPVQHYRPDHTSAYHEVEVERDSRLAEIVGTTRFEVNSRHHQIVDRQHIGGRLRPVAFAPDGVVEAAEDRDGQFLVAVQWHPEDLTDREEHLRLFKALVEASRSG
jgi:putative glutamine amidotransferase